MQTNTDVDRDLPETVRAPLTALCGRLEDALGDSLVSVILYGDIVKGDDAATDESDIAIMIVLKDVRVETLDHAVAPIKKGPRTIHLRPFVVSEEDLKSSTDVFPIKFLDMQKHHRLLCGKDVLADLSISHEHLRLRCEQEIKNVLLRLRNVYLRHRLHGDGLHDALTRASAAFLNSLSAALVLKTGESPTLKREIAAAAVKEFDLDATTLADVLDLRERKSKSRNGELRALYGAFMSVVQKAAHAVDQLEG